MANLHTVQVINNSGSAGKFYNLFSAKATIEGGGNTSESTKSITWFRSRPAAPGGMATFRYDNSFYGFLGCTSNFSKNLQKGNKVDPTSWAKATVGSFENEGTIFVVDESPAFSEIGPDDDTPAPPTQAFKIITTTGHLRDNYDVIGVARGKSLGDGITPAPTDVVGLKPGNTYTITTSRAVYVKATNFAEGTIQISPDKDPKAIMVQFPNKMKRATVTEDSRGNFKVTYSPSSD